MSDLIELGTVVETGKPYVVPREKLGHVHIRGMTGSGKSSLSLTKIISELMRPYEINGQAKRDPIVVTDLGGDLSLFHITRLLAKQENRVFRFLTLDPDSESHFFPPFQVVGKEQNALRMAQMLVTALHMDHGLVYGGNYFSQQNASALLAVARKLTEESASATLLDVTDYLDDPKNRKRFKDADQIRMTIEFLSEYDRLTEAPDPTLEINFERALEESQVIYLFLPTMNEPMTARLVAGLGFYSTIAAATQRAKRGKEKRRVHLIVDEFQEIVGRNLGAALAQSRKFGLNLYLANQSTSQLENSDLNLADVVFEGTQTKIFYSCVGKKDTDDLQSLSRDKIKILGGKSQQKFSETTSSREVIVPTLERDTILDVSARFGYAFLVRNDGTGHQEPLIISQKHAFKDLSDWPLPLRKLEDKKPKSKAISPEEQAARQRREDALKSLLKTKKMMEDWKRGDGDGKASK